MVKGSNLLLVWNLKGIGETFGVPIYDCQLEIWASTPIESMITEQELCPGVLVSSKSNPVAFGVIYIVDEWAYIGKLSKVIMFSCGGT
jgi:hypothetical protein